LEDISTIENDILFLQRTYALMLEYKHQPVVYH